MKKFIYAILVSVALFGCVSTGGGVTAGNYTSQLPKEALKDMYLVRVASAGNPISDGMLITALEAGSGSNAVKGINDILGNPNINIGVVGPSEAINAATLRTAFRNHPANSSSAKVYFVGSEKYKAKLQQLAQEKGIKFTYVIKGGK